MVSAAAGAVAASASGAGAVAASGVAAAAPGAGVSAVSAVLAVILAFPESEKEDFVGGMQFWLLQAE